jgi:hypothetical protein
MTCHPMKLFMPLFIFFCFVVGSALSQHLLFQRNRYDIALYESGDKITFRVEGSKKKVTAKILSFEDSVIVFQEFRLNPDKITDMYVDARSKEWYFLKFKYSKLFLFAGVGFLLLETLNTDEISDEALLISGTLIGAGILTKLLMSKRIPVRGKRKLAIID